MTNGTRPPETEEAVRERVIAALHEPIGRVMQASLRTVAAWERRDLATTEGLMAELKASVDAYLDEMRPRVR